MKRLLFVLIFVLLLPVTGWATNYYVDTAADPGGDGTTQALTGANCAFKTIAQVNAASFSGDDFIYFKKGCTWREKLTVPSSGSSGHPITFSAYGTGADPIISGSDTVSSFTNTQNLVANGGMEDWAAGAPVSWTEVEGAGCSVSQELVDIHGGSSAGKIVMGAVNNLTYVQQKVAVLANKTYNFEFYHHSTGGVFQIGFSVNDDGAYNNYWLQSDGTWSASAYSFTIPTVGSYTSWTKTLTFPNANGNLLIQVKRSNAANQTLYFDDFVLNPTHIYTASFTTEPYQVFQNGSRLTKGSSATALNNGEWFWVSNVLYIRSDSGTPTGITVSQRDNIGLNGKSYITIKNLDLEESNGRGIYSASATSNIIIDSNTISRAFLMGIGTTSGAAVTNVTISNNTISYCGGHGILMMPGCTNWNITTNTLYNFSQLPQEGFGDLMKYNAGIRGFCEDDSINNIIIEHNTIYNGGKVGAAYITSPAGGVVGPGIWFDSTQTGNTIRYNNVYDCLNTGIKIEFSYSNNVYYNIVHGIVKEAAQGGQGILVGAYSAKWDVKNNKIYNNVVYGCDAAGIAIWGESTSAADGCVGNLIKNNISVGNDGPQLQAWYGGENDGVMGHGNQYQYNCFGPETANFIQWAVPGFYSTYDTWETAYGGTTHSVEADPLMVAPLSGNYRIPFNSPCRNAGIDVSLTIDYAGMAVPFSPSTNPAIGAYEALAGGGLSPGLGLSGGNAPPWVRRKNQ